MISSVKVLGLGLVGGSLARLLVDRAVDVVAWDAEASTCVAAETAGIRIAPSYEHFLAARSDLVLVATPIDALAQCFDDIARSDDRDSVVSDVGSVKVATKAWATESGLADRYVGLHPMAGTEARGFSASDAGIYVGIPWVVLSNARAVDRTCDVITFLCTLTDARVLVTDSTSHDASAALVSHVPHAVANALLCEVADSPKAGLAFSMAAGSFRYMTRVAGTDRHRTENMLVWNREAVAQGLLDLARRLTEIGSQLQQRDAELPFLARAEDARADMEKAVAPRLEVVRREDVIEVLLALSAGGQSIGRLEREAEGYLVDTG